MYDEITENRKTSEDKYNIKKQLDNFLFALFLNIVAKWYFVQCQFHFRQSQALTDGQKKFY